MKRYHEIYRVEQLPVFQNRMFDSEQEAKECTKGDVVLVQDHKTGLIFNQAFRPDLIQYDVNYQNEQAVSAIFRQHLQEMSEVVAKHFWAHSLIEVGCGKGHFLEMLQAHGFEIKGLDPAYEGSNPSVIKGYFSPELGLRANGVILRHVLEHIQDPIGFLSNIRQSNGGGGKIFVEVPCLDWICRHHTWFDVFYEHVNYFRLSDFERMFGRIYESGHTFGGQYLYVVADLATIRMPTYDESTRFKFPKIFFNTVNRYAVSLKHRKTSVIWGGASKGVIFALFMLRAGVNIDLVVDINPAKQGKYIPGSGLRVYSPPEAIKMLEPGALIFVMNSNYIGEIKQLTNNKFNYLEIDGGHI